MYLINNKALVTASSGQVLFFKIKTDLFTGDSYWDLYKTIHKRGTIYFIKGNKRI